MSKASDYHEYLMLDVFRDIPGISAKSMFGGYGYYKHSLRSSSNKDSTAGLKDGVIFAILADDQLYFKVGEGNKKDYEKAGSKPFVYPMKNGKSTTMSYWELPADILEDSEKLPEWIEKSVKESIRSKKS